MKTDATIVRESLDEIDALRKSLRELHIMHTKQKIVLLNALKEKLGPEVGQIVEQANSAATFELYRRLFDDAKGRDIEDLIQVIWEPLRNQGFEFIVEKRDDAVQIHCMVCPWQKLYGLLGAAEWGYQLYCAADAALVDQFNPEIGFKRTRTLMEGHECCDHFYFMKK